MDDTSGAAKGPLPELIEEAGRQAEAAARRSGVVIRTLAGLEEEALVSALLDRVWGVEGLPAVPANLLRAFTHAGNYLAGAYSGERLVGAAFGFLASTEDLHLHSHMTGVDPTYQTSGVGYALKLHQRSWALEQGLRRIEWTFDPLVRRNAYFNLVKLGTIVTGYHVNFYGVMPDAINAGDESDRVVVSWDLDTERVRTACGDGLTDPEINSGSVALSYDDEANPVISEADGDPIRCRIPEDIVALRRSDPGAAARWRAALRETLGNYLNDGMRATSITKDGWYLIEGSSQ